MRGGGLKKDFSSLVTVLLLVFMCVSFLSLSIHKKKGGGVIFGDLRAWTDLGRGQGCFKCDSF